VGIKKILLTVLDLLTLLGYTADTVNERSCYMQRKKRKKALKRMYHGDCLEVMKGFKEDTFHAIVTDPPYGLKFMGKTWDHGVPGTPFWEEALRVCRPGAYLLAFGGTRTFHRLAVAIEDSGWEIRDTLMWVYGSGFPKSHNLKGEWNGWGTALKPAWEPIIMARKPINGTVANNVQKHGCGGINVDECRVGAYDSSTTARKPSELKQGAIGYLRNGKPKFGGNGSALGRWPANLIHDGSEEVLEGFPSVNGKYGMTQHGSGTNIKYGVFKRSEQSFVTDGVKDSGSAARFFYCAKASKADRGEGNNHPTVKPRALMEYLCKMVSPPGGKVLDPFMGSGSTLLACKAIGVTGVGIELSEEYFRIAEKRLTI
jgi:DNA modification methylase